MKHLLSVFLLLVLFAPTLVYAVDYANMPLQQLQEYAGKGDAVAQNWLGYRYREGKGVQKDFAEAVKWYRKSAEQGNAWAQNELGNCYYRGNGVQKDFNEAFKWCRKAAEQGHADAQCGLGNLYFSGEGVQKDLHEAAKWFRKAAEQGHAEAQATLAFFYQNGGGVQKNLQEAVNWYRKAAEQGHPFAQNSLGEFYYAGEGVQKDIAAAVKWVRKSADQGFSRAQYNLGVSYENGYSLQKDLKEAANWYRKAAEQGDEDAKKALARLEMTTNPNSRIVYLKEEKAVVSNGVTEKIETTIPFVVDIAKNTVIYPEKYSNNLQYNKDEFTEKEDVSSLAGQYENGTLQLTIKSTFRPVRMKIDNMALPQEAWANSITIEENKDAFNYRAIIKYALKDKSQLQQGLKVTIASEAGREFVRVLKESGGKVVVEEPKAVEF